jgi:hypothetical protein
MDAAGGVLDDEERVEPVQGDGVEVEQVAGDDALGLRREELRPGRSGPLRYWVDPRRAQDLPDGGGSDLVAESGELAVDAPIAPVGILAGQAQDQSANACGDGGAASSDRLVGTAAADESAVPPQDRRGFDQESESAMGG